MRFQKTFVIVVLLFTLFLAFPSTTDASHLSHNTEPMVFRLVGTGHARAPEPANGEQGMWCFDVDLENAATGEKVGYATDCLEVAGVIENNPDDPMDDGLQIIGTTLFYYMFKGKIISQGLTTVQPTTHGSPDVTHITGSIPTPGENNVLSATRGFYGLEASVRLSGAVDMSGFGGEMGDPITFDCLFVITPL
jgi:hypothetical protein